MIKIFFHLDWRCESIFYKVKKWIRKRYIIHKYKKNFKSGRLIYLKQNDRQYGLSTMLMKDSIENNIPVLVSTLSAKNRMAHEMYLLGQLHIAPSITEEYARNNLIITPTENDLRDRRFDWIYVDNQCRESDVYKALEINSMIGIANGFVTSYLMA